MSEPPSARAPASTTGPLLRLAAGVVLLSFAPVLVRLADVGPTPAGFYRMAGGGVVLAILVVLRGGRWRGGRSHLALCGLAGAQFAAARAAWHRSINLVGPGLATILANLQVFVLAGVGVLVLKERVSARLAVAIPLAVLGLLLVFEADWNTLGAEYRWGVVFGLLTAISYATYLLSLRGARRRAGPDVEAMATVATLSLISAALLALLVVLESESFRIPSLATGGTLVAYALLIQVVAWVLISSGLPHIAASRVGLLLLLQPTLAFVWDVLLFARPTSIVEGSGAVLTIGAIYLGLSGRSQQQRSPPAAQHA